MPDAVNFINNWKHAHVNDENGYTRELPDRLLLFLSQPHLNDDGTPTVTVKLFVGPTQELESTLEYNPEPGQLEDNLLMYAAEHAVENARNVMRNEAEKLRAKAAVYDGYAEILANWLD